MGRSNVTLKPCPLCGDAVVIDREGIYCDCCHLVLRFDDYIYSGEAKDWEEAREMGIEAWNVRADHEN